MLTKLIETLKNLSNNNGIDTSSLVWATPEWSSNHITENIRLMAVESILVFGEKGVSIIPAASKAIKEAGFQLVTTRDSVNGIIAIVLYSQYGKFILYWDKETIAKFIDTTRSAVLDNPKIDMPPYKKGILGRLSKIVDVIMGRL